MYWDWHQAIPWVLNRWYPRIFPNVKYFGHLKLRIKLYEALFALKILNAKVTHANLESIILPYCKTKNKNIGSPIIWALKIFYVFWFGYHQEWRIESGCFKILKTGSINEPENEVALGSNRGQTDEVIHK